jgi:hypothetical protein
MAPRHDEIVKRLDDGFTVAWDTTKRDTTKAKDVGRVVAERSKQLGKIFGTGDTPTGRDRSPAPAAMNAAARAASPRRRSPRGR